jgi:hypothetical protein
MAATTRVQTTGTMPLVFVRAVPWFAEPVEEYRPGQSVSRLALVGSDVDGPKQFDAADVMEQKQRPFCPAELSQCHGQPVLTWVSAGLRSISDAVTDPCLMCVQRRPVCSVGKPHRGKS